MTKNLRLIYTPFLHLLKDFRAEIDSCFCKHSSKVQYTLNEKYSKMCRSLLHLYHENDAFMMFFVIFSLALIAT